MPDSLTPPKGATSVEMNPVLTPEDPVLERLADAPGARQVAGHVVRREAVGRPVRDRDRLVLGLEPADRRHRAECLLAAHAHPGADAREDRRAVELALDPVATGHELGPRLERVGDVALDLLDRRLVDERPDLDAVGEAVRDGERLNRGREALEEHVVDPGLHEHPVRGDAGLAGVPELAHERRIHRDIKVGVVEDDERSIAAKLQRDLLDLIRALTHQQLSHLGRPGEAELAHARVGRQLAARSRARPPHLR